MFFANSYIPILATNDKVQPEVDTVARAKP